MIQNLDQFMRKRTGVKHMNSQKRELCLKCLNFFKNEELLKKHEEIGNAESDKETF